jgi:WD40 repeat protein
MVLVLDNFEAVIDVERSPESVSEARDRYLRFLKRVVDEEHNSLVILTTRMLPRLIESNGDEFVRVLPLSGLPDAAALDVLTHSQLRGTPEELTEFVQRYGGNPLAIGFAADLTVDLFAGSVGAFLRSNAALLGGIRQLLDAHFACLPAAQLLLLVRLATAREPLSFDDIVEGTFRFATRDEVATGVQQLLRRSLIERQEGRFYLQYLVQECVIAHYVEQVSTRVSTADATVLANFSLVDTQRPVYVRDAQRRITVDRLRTALKDHLGGERPVLDSLRDLLNHVRYGADLYGSFVAANVLEIYSSMRADLSELDFSSTCLRHVDLSDRLLRDVTMSECEFVDCRFASAHEHVFGLALASNGSFAALGYVGGAIVLVEVPTGRVIRSFDWNAVWLRAVAISPDDRVLAATDDRGRVRIVHLESGDIVDFPGNGRQVRSLSFSAQGRILFAGGEEGIVREIDPHNVVDSKVILEAGSEIWGLACDDEILAIATGADGLRLMELSVSGAPTERSVERHEPSSAGRSVAMSPDGGRVFLGCEDGAVRAWARSGRFSEEVCNHAGPVWAVDSAVVDGRELLFSGSHDGSVRVSDVGSPGDAESIGSLVSEEGPVWPLAVDRGGTTLVTVSGSSTIRFWNPISKEPIERLRGGSPRTFSVAANFDTTILATGGQDGSLRIWDSRLGECVHELRGHGGGVRVMVFGPSGHVLASAGEDGDVRIWDAARGELRAVLEGPTNWIWCMTFDDTGRYIAAAGADLHLHIWPLRGMFPQKRLSGHSARIVGLAFIDGSRRIASCSVDGACWTWDTDMAKGQRFALLPDGATCMTPLRDSRIAVGDRGGNVTIFDLSKREPLQTTRHVHSAQLLSLTHVPSMGLIVTGAENGEMGKLHHLSAEVLGVVNIGVDPIRSLAPCERSTEVVAARGTEKLSIVALPSLRLTRSVSVPRQYERLQLKGARGLASSEIDNLCHLGAVFAVRSKPPPPRSSGITDGSSAPRRTSIFISYSHEDAVQMSELRKHLRSLEASGRAEVWVDALIGAGRDWDSEIDQRLEAADIILVLLSADYLDSSYCWREMDRAVARATAGEAVTIPIVLRQCDWEHLDIGRFQGLPEGAIPIASSGEPDEMRAQVSTKIRLIAEERARVRRTEDS